MLTKNQRLAVFMLVSGFSNSEIAAEIGVTPRTIRRWMKDKLFADSLAIETKHAWEAARAQSQCAARRLMDNATAALRALQPLLLSDRTDPKIVVRAADVTLRNAARWVALLDKEERVPMLKMESAADVGPDVDADDNDEIPLVDTVRDEEVAQISAIRRKLDGKAYPEMDTPAGDKDRGDDTESPEISATAI